MRGDEGLCPACSKSSSRIHSRYQRTLTDAPIAGRSVRILLRVRRFFCDNAECRSKTFVEQVDGLTRRWSRMSEGLRRMLTTIGLALAGRAGARLATTLGMPTGRDRLLRLVRASPDPPTGDIAVLGIDDFAVKRGHNYGTVLIDCETRKVVDVLVGRDAEPVTAWLHKHAKPTVICRDRASAYAEAARTAAPEAVRSRTDFTSGGTWLQPWKSASRGIRVALPSLSTRSSSPPRRPPSRQGRWPNAAEPITPWSTNCSLRALVSGRSPAISAGRTGRYRSMPTPPPGRNWSSDRSHGRAWSTPSSTIWRGASAKGASRPVPFTERSPSTASAAATRSSASSSSSTAADPT
ncbi:ISL3 family transposase [Actinoplanes solisilvae]|uniref:ISL3 family transposase n=1 Tax=Actinoplanes solisilvae TaxID=2486853 RepID=UPI003D79F35C